VVVVVVVEVLTAPCAYTAPTTDRTPAISNKTKAIVTPFLSGFIT